MKTIGRDFGDVARKVYATASGVLPNGKAVVVNSDGSVSVVDATSGGAAFGTAASAGFSGGWGLLVSSLSATKFVAFAQNDNGNSNYGTAIIGTVSGSSISFGTKVSTGVATYEDPQVVGLTETKFILVYKDSSGNQGKARVGTVSGTSISFGSVVVFESGQTNLNKNNAVTRLTDTKFLVSYTDSSDGSKAKSIVGTISGTSVSFGSAATFATPNSSQYATVSALSETKVIIAWSDTPSGSRGRAIVGTISGTSISYGSAVNYDTSSVIRHSIAALSDTKFVIAYQDGGNSSYYTAICGTVSGTSITLGTAVVFNAANSQNYWPVATKINENQCGITFGDSANSVHGALIIGTASGTSLSFGTKIIYTSSFSRPAGATLVGTTNFVIGHRVSNVYKAINYQLLTSNLTAENYIGMSSGGVEYDEGPASVGSAVVFENANTSSISAAFDSNSNKVVIAYVDNGNSGHGTAIVGTVSGTSISFGSPTVFEASLNVAGTSTTFDSNANKVVISFSDAAAGNYGTAIVGTVSGTSISFGTPTVFESASTSQISSTFDSNLNKVVIAYRDNGNSVYGTAIVGTVSNTSISFGSATVFESAAVANPSAVFDSNSNKVVIAYGDAGNSDYGTAIVGTVSGTSISFGSAALFESAAVDNVAGTFDSNSNKVVILYRDNGNNSNGTAIVATVSGTSISFGTAVVFNVGNSYFFSAAFDSTTNQVVVTYTINSGALGTAIVGTVSGTSISFGSPSTYGNDASAVVFDSNSNKMVIAYTDAASPYVGKALVFKSAFNNTVRGQVASGGAALVNTKGAINTNQTALTAGQSYFVQTDGTITTTAGTPSVFAGTAVSATKLIVKG